MSGVPERAREPGSGYGDEGRCHRPQAVWSRMQPSPESCYFFDPGAGAADPFAEGAAAIVFVLTCFGFLVSRPPFAMLALLVPGRAE